VSGCVLDGGGSLIGFPNVLDGGGSLLLYGGASGGPCSGQLPVTWGKRIEVPLREVPFAWANIPKQSWPRHLDWLK